MSAISEDRLRFAESLADPNFSLSIPEVAKAVIRDLLAEVRVAPQPEPEYEYGVGWNHNGGILAYRTGTQESAELDAVERPEFEVNPWFVVRRTPARHEGKWEPVANQSNGSES